MFGLGEKVVYGIHGVCRIIAFESKTVDRKKVEYYVLEPIGQAEARFYVPTQNQAAVAKLRPLLTRDQLDELLCSEDVEKDFWIADENQRKQCYRELMGSGDRVSLIGMVRALHKHKTEQIAQGRKFHLCDENFLRDAEKLLSSEFSMVLGISQSEVADYIKKVIGVPE